MKILTAIFFVAVATGAFARQAAIEPGLTAVFDPGKNIVKLKWQQNDAEVVRYILQRSSDNSSWADIASLQITSENKGKFVKYSDNRATPGKSYYRLKIFYDINVFRYTSSVMIIVGQAGAGWTMYPVPVTTTLNLQYNGSTAISGVISVIIQSVTSGQILCRLRVASNTRLIQVPVSNLGRGVYDLRIYVSEKVVWNQRFIK